VASAISVRDVSKHFKVAHERYPSLKEKVIHLGRNPGEDFVALHPMSIEIAEGTTFGLLGHNGSGKSTLLKCIAGLLRPTTGEIETRGRLAALLELGAGFQAELTGRENIFLNGAILGMSKRDLARRFDEIVAFAELEQFIDTQVRFYSSGMYVRLGFAVAVSVEPDILLVDEVLSVGDEAFQRKCLERVEQFQQEGRTIVVVTHAADLVRRVCQVAAVLDHGHLVALGEPRESVRVFREHLRKSQPRPRVGDQVVDDTLQLVDVRLERDGVPATVLAPGDPLTVRAAFDVDAPIDGVVFTVMIHDAEGGVVHRANNRIAGCEIDRVTAPGEIVFSFPDVLLPDGEYAITVCATSADAGSIFDWHEQRYRFEMRDPAQRVTSFDFPVEVTFVEETRDVPVPR
jgi:ABC-2 type transport system ATP-binding protein